MGGQVRTATCGKLTSCRNRMSSYKIQNMDFFYHIMVIRRRKGLGNQYSNPSREWEPDS
jgi:hypothetical protein